MKYSFEEIIEFKKGKKDIVFLEGLHAFKHAVRFSAEMVDIFIDENQKKKVEENLLKLAGEKEYKAFTEAKTLPSDEFLKLAPNAHTGIFALAKKPKQDFPKGGWIVYLQNPSSVYNIGASIRTTAACPKTSAFFVSGEHEPYNSATLRTSAGLHFALSAVSNIKEESLLKFAEKNGYQILSLDPEGESISNIKIPDKALFVFGTERDGITDELKAKSDKVISLPMRDKVSSLNLATSVSATLNVALLLNR